MKSKTAFATLGVILFLFAALELPQGYAVSHDHTRPLRASAPPRTPLEATSNPSAGCTQLGLTDKHGFVILTHGQQSQQSLQLIVSLQNAQPGNSYDVRIGYNTNGACDGSWESLGKIYADQNGAGTFTHKFDSSGNQQYIIELDNTADTIALYATPFVTVP